MHGEAIPVVRLSIESMTSQILHHLGLEGSELGEVIEQRIKEETAILFHDADHEIRNVIRTEIRRVVTQRVKDYFSYGNGASFLNRKVTECLDEVFKEREEDDERD